MFRFKMHTKWPVKGVYICLCNIKMQWEVKGLSYVRYILSWFVWQYFPCKIMEYYGEDEKFQICHL